MDTVVKPRYDNQMHFSIHATMSCGDDIEYAFRVVQQLYAIITFRKGGNDIGV
ncbi:hypothetical protein RMONA_05345 [Rickettsia monacensis]|uniref:Uncharacterized protein n=1 Tax=Rickettsia monacensis TaxID=109232 RepID=A0A0B7J382_9RICK|nr:hypothetical protein [Rickettsia monacensis]CDI29604.1 hypothetical protein RMONA_4775 [Rickettsia monacensis IrR/Munich]CEO17445.1 hypothetical protein RMONA_05345 [Rickettsia monacensis]